MGIEARQKPRQPSPPEPVHVPASPHGTSLAASLLPHRRTGWALSSPAAARDRGSSTPSAQAPAGAEQAHMPRSLEVRRGAGGSIGLDTTRHGHSLPHCFTAKLYRSI